MPSFFKAVRAEGLEPPCLAASDPKSDMSTNFTTPGKIWAAKIRENTIPTLDNETYFLVNAIVSLPKCNIF